MTEPTPKTNNEPMILHALAEDWQGLYVIPIDIFNEIDPTITLTTEEIPKEVRTNAIQRMVRMYEKFFACGWLNVAIYDSVTNTVSALNKEDSLQAIQNRDNYDYESVSKQWVVVSASDQAREMLERNLYRYRYDEDS